MQYEIHREKGRAPVVSFDLTDRLAVWAPGLGPAPSIPAKRRGRGLQASRSAPSLQQRSGNMLQQQQQQQPQSESKGEAVGEEIFINPKAGKHIVRLQQRDARKKFAAEEKQKQKAREQIKLVTQITITPRKMHTLGGDIDDEDTSTAKKKATNNTYTTSAPKDRATDFRIAPLSSSLMHMKDSIPMPQVNNKPPSRERINIGTHDLITLTHIRTS